MLLLKINFLLTRLQNFPVDKDKLRKLNCNEDKFDRNKKDMKNQLRKKLATWEILHIANLVL